MSAGDVTYERLQRRLERERRARREAEEIAERTTSLLYERQRELELLRAVAVAANEATTIEDALRLAIDAVCEHLNWPIGHAYLVVPPAGALGSTRQWHLADPERFERFRAVSEAHVFEAGIGLPGRVLASGGPCWIEDVTAAADFVRHEVANDLGVRGALAFPILVGDETVGVLEAFADRPVAIDAALLAVVAQVGTQLGRVVERSRARGEQDRERTALAREQAARVEAERMEGLVRGLQVLLDVTLAHDRLDEMLAELVPRVCEVLSAEAATILLANEDGSLEARSSTAAREGPAPLVIEPEAGIAGKVAARAEPLLIQDPKPGQAVDPAMRDMSSVVSVPLMARGAVTGVIQAGVAAPRRFTEDDLLLLGLAADRVALAVERVRVFEREHRIAETLQRSLLPDKLPRLPGLEIAARYLPAASEAEVGGDWYDVIAIDSGRVGLVMGDVAGKGLAAASMVGRVRSAMRAYALEGHGPQGLVERLNQLVWSELEDSQMVTLVYAVFDSGDSRLDWVNAGHLPPLVIGADGATRFLDTPSSVPLGVMPFPTYEQGTVELEGGASVVVYTDGLVERPGELLDVGLARFERAAAPALADDPEGLCDALLAELVPRGGAADDVALLVLHSPPLSERIGLEIAAEPGELAAMRALLRRWLAQAQGTEEESTEILTAVGEAAANAIEHGNVGAEQRPLAIAGLLREGEVDITVSDRGSWRPEHGDDGGGRGLVLMEGLMDSVEVTAGADGTSVRMRRRLAATDPHA